MRGVVNYKMIVLAREARGLNQGELAEKIRMSATNLSKIERGDVGVSEELLHLIAATTGYPHHFFLQAGEIVPEHLGYRRRAHVAQKLLAPIHARTNIFRNHLQFLTAQLGIEPPKLPRLALNESANASQLAARLRRIWKIPPGPVENLIKIVEAAGIGVMSFDFETERVDSRSIYTANGFPLICLNKRLTADRQRFSLAYELGVLLLRGKDDDDEEKIIHDANAFAAAFLMPGRELKQQMKNGVTISLLASLKKKWKVSMIALLYRADDLGLITPNQKRYLLQQFNILGIRRREPQELDLVKEEPRLFLQSIASYRSKTGLGTVEMAALLCLHADEFMELYS